jgi:ABC-2 type transport system ATP-binding protein
MSGELVLEATGLRKRFGDNQAVNGVDISVGPGETFGLLGPNGAGKTTSISMIAGLLAADSGSVMVAGRPINTRSTDAKAAIGLVPQDLAIYPDLSARENLTFFGRLYGMKGPSLAKRIAEVLDVIGLADRANDRTKEFSGGMKRRLNIGIGLLHQPTLLILDEPTVGVDPQSRNAILESVEQLSRAGMAVLYTTHYMEEAERLCDRVAIIDQGVVKAEGTRRQLVELVGEADRIHITATGDLQAARAAAASVSGVLEATVADHSIEVMAGMASSLLPEVLARVAAGGAAITSVAVIEPNLEAVFLHLTGKALRD